MTPLTWKSVLAACCLTLAAHAATATDTTPPTVTYVLPADGATGVSVTTPYLLVAFSETIDRSTLGPNIYVTEGADPAGPWVSTGYGYGESSCTLYPWASQLHPGTVYGIHVLTGVTDVYGNHLAASFHSTFSTAPAVVDTTPPQLVGTSPADSSVQVPVDIQTVAAFFSEPMDRQSLYGNVYLTEGADPSGTRLFPGGTAETAYYVLLADSQLKPNTLYGLHVLTGAMDAAGNHLAHESHVVFTTGALPIDATTPSVYSVTPADSATEVPLTTSSVWVVFNEAMNRSTYANHVFLSSGLTPDGPIVTTCRGSNAAGVQMFLCTGVLQPGTRYWVHVTTDVTDVAGNHLAQPLLTHFTTAPSYRIVSVADVGNDQGRHVRLQWYRNAHDRPGSSPTVTAYSIWRRVAAGYLATRATTAARTAGPLAFPSGTWDYVASVPAHGDETYSTVCETVSDSNSSGTHWSVFLVRAETGDPYTFYDTAPDSGQSVDNLSPAAPGPLAITFAAGSTRLHWRPSAASDFAAFRLYRGTGSSFPPSAASLVYGGADTTWTDSSSPGATYELTAVDLNGNESVAAVATLAALLDAGPSAPAELALSGAQPNPGRGGTLGVAFTLPSAAPARLELLDVAGRRVAVRDVGALGAGRHAVRLGDATRLRPGLYLVRLTQSDAIRTARAIILD